MSVTVERICEFCGSPFLARQSQVVRGRAKYCGLSCRSKARFPAAGERFWSRVNRNGPVPTHQPDLGACWLWTGGLSRAGYGVLWVDGRQVLAHRYSHELAAGHVPPGCFVCHRCDTPACVRPDHLFVGTAAENSADMARKGRATSPSGERHRSVTHPETVLRGEQKSQAKLSDAAVAEIRRAWTAGEAQRSLARRFGVDQSQVSRVARGLVWRHVR